MTGALVVPLAHTVNKPLASSLIRHERPRHVSRMFWSCHSLKQTGTHAGRKSCTYTYEVYKQVLPAACTHLRKTSSREEMDAFNVLLGISWKQKRAQSVILLFPLGQQAESMSRYRFNCITDSFVSCQC